MMTAWRLRELLNYDPETGLFTWLARRGGPAIAGSVAGWANGDGYIRVSLDSRSYLAHRLAVLYMTGSWPARQVDHIDRDKTNNRWINLREATNQQNCRNRPRRRNNKSGVTGVHWDKRDGKWTALIGENGGHHYLGNFAAFDDAVTARKAAEVVVFGEFAPASN